MKPGLFRMMALVPLIFSLDACPQVSSPDGGSDGSAGPNPTAILEAGTSVVDNLCAQIVGVTNSGVVRTICATVDEVAQLVAFVLTLRTADAGTPPACVPVASTSFCASKDEIAQGVLYLTKLRQARLMLDGGAR